MRTYYGRGFAYAAKGDNDRAIQDFDQTIKINPSYSAAYFNRGKAYARKGEYLRAVADRFRFAWRKSGTFGRMRLILSFLVLVIAVGLILKRFWKSL
jgi:tetratricopeptide (TPR) repeat protein